VVVVAVLVSLAALSRFGNDPIGAPPKAPPTDAPKAPDTIADATNPSVVGPALPAKESDADKLVFRHRPLGETGLTTWRLEPDGGALLVTPADYALFVFPELEFPNLPADDCEISVSIHPLGENGVAGLVMGLNDGGTSGAMAQFHSVELFVGAQPSLIGSGYRADHTSSLSPTVTRFGRTPVKSPPDQLATRLTVHVVRGELKSVRLNDKSYPEIVEQFRKRGVRLQGRFGFLCFGTPFRFANPEVNGKEVDFVLSNDR
jgi:hypothetical protein